MVKRRDVLKLGLAAGGSSVLAASRVMGQDQDLLKYLCPPDGFPVWNFKPSPNATPFVAKLFIPPIKQPVPQLTPAPDPRAHQLYQRFPPKQFYEVHETEFRWQYHPQPPYSDSSGKGVSWSWGFDGVTPGPIYQARYGEPILVRRYNNLPPVGQSQVTFALPSTTTHLHNAHTASESDGYPMDWIDSGEFWDHHYANFPLGNHPNEKLSTLWYHDHRMDFTAANVYAGLSGFYLLFDEQDSGNEQDPNPAAWRLPSGKYDVPLMLHDVIFTETGQVVFDIFNTDGILGDKYTVNRKIQPYFQVERRKYRFRIIDGGPSRFYQLSLSSGKPFIVITGDGNFQPEPFLSESIYLSVGQRVDVIIDFSQYKAGDQIYLLNRLEQINGKGPSGRLIDGDPQTLGVMRFDVIEATGPDPSRIPDYFRPLPQIDLREVKFHRTWEFDYDGGLWTINGEVFEANRIDAGVEINSAEVWTLRNNGKNWSHPIHCHFTEFLILEINGKPYPHTHVQSAEQRRKVFIPEFPEEGQAPAQAWMRREPVKVFMGGPRRDVATLLPGDEIKVFFRFKDFHGKYVMHCHNVVHEDHAMMIRWDIVDQGFPGPRRDPDLPAHLEERPGSATVQKNAKDKKP